MSSQANLWDRDGIQFPRLLAELRGIVTLDQYQALQESMDLGESDLDELFDRADAEWERIKKRVVRRGSRRKA